MSLSDPRQLANINGLRSYIDSTHTLSIRQKGDLIKDLNRKKENMISSITAVLTSCRDSEAVLYNRWIGTSNKLAHNHLEEYNTYLKDQHDRGTEIISQINAMNNFEQLNKYEVNTVDPYLDSLKTMCGKYSQKIIKDEAIPLIQSSPDLQSVTYSPYNMPVRTAVSAPVMAVAPSPVTVIPTTPVASPVPVRFVQATPVRVVQSAPVVRATPVRVVQPAPVVQATPVRVVQPAPVYTQPFQSVRVGEPRAVVLQNKAGERRIVTATPVGPRGVHRGVIVQHYSSRAPGTLNLPKDTIVNVIKYEGDWALVETTAGHEGYVSRHFIRPID